MSKCLNVQTRTTSDRTVHCSSVFQLNPSTASATRRRVRAILGFRLYRRVPTDENWKQMAHMRNLLRSEVMKNSDKSFFRHRATGDLKQYYEFDDEMHVEMKIPDIYRVESCTYIRFLFMAKLECVMEHSSFPSRQNLNASWSISVSQAD